MHYPYSAAEEARPGVNNRAKRKSVAGELTALDQLGSG